ncbi:LLM class flavin-dependent oxidoreductase [Actinomycetospora flava]|uniref:LLM class flavin-dependent oxidoreductase n=1 Tax=Actinomycetospora flava TaxID=3129232 RepID=A0ABU8M2K2_9PSEU
MHLNAFILSSGHHEASWRYPGSTPERMFDAAFYTDLARTAEAARFDAVFLADIPKLDDNVAYNAVGRLDPLLVLATIAAATDHIGLIGTASTTYSYPWSLARSLSTLDHLSRGRAAWNIVTTDSAAAARNFGLDANPDPESRYERADEYVDAVLRLFDSWEDDAILLDRDAGRYAAPEKIHPPRLTGWVDGALTTPRPPQGHPVLVQAGASNHGRGFAAKYAEAIFTAQQRLEDAQTFAQDIRKRAADLGRDPEHIKILPGLSPFIAGTEHDARKLQQEFDELTVVEYGLVQLRDLVGIDVGTIPLDEPVPLDLVADAGEIGDNQRSRRQLVAGIIRRERPTLRTLLHRLAGARGHRVVAGTPEQIADTMQEWYVEGGADGFNVMPPWLPGGLEVFVETVVPILRERGLFRAEYEGTTLRENLGLPRPANRYTATG